MQLCLLFVGGLLFCHEQERWFLLFMCSPVSVDLDLLAQRDTTANGLAWLLVAPAL